MKVFKAIMVFCLCSLHLNVFAYSTKLVDIYLFPEDGRIFSFFMEMDGMGKATGAYLEYTNEDGVLSYDHFSFQKIIEEGEVIYRKDGRDIIIFHCPKCSVETGGTLDVKYLHNGIYGDYDHLYVTFNKKADQNWGIFSENKEEIKFMQLHPNYFFGTLIGIDEITINTHEASNLLNFYCRLGLYCPVR